MQSVVSSASFSSHCVSWFCFEVLLTAGFEEGLIPCISLGFGLCVFLPTLLCVRGTVSGVTQALAVFTVLYH